MDRTVRAFRHAVVSVFSATLLSLLFTGSALAKNEVITTRFTVYQRVAPLPADTTGGLAIELQGLWGSPNEIPDLFSFSQTDLIATRIELRQRQNQPQNAVMLDRAEDWFDKDPSGLRSINLFGSPDGKTGLFAFRVKVKNSTSQPIHMADWRVYLQVAGQDEAIAPSGDLAFYNQWMLGKEVAMNNHKEGPIAAIQDGYVIRHVPYPVGIAGALLAHKFPSWDAVNLIKKEVPPGASVTGFLLFPVEIGADSISVVFSSPQASSGSAAAGPPAYEFKFRKVAAPYWWDKRQKRWAAGEGAIGGK